MEKEGRRERGQKEEEEEGRLLEHTCSKTKSQWGPDPPDGEVHCASLEDDVRLGFYLWSLEGEARFGFYRWNEAGDEDPGHDAARDEVARHACCRP